MQKFFWKDLTLEKAYALGIENIKDIIACGFDVSKTFIFSDLEYVGVLYRNIVKLQKAFKFAAVASSFGFDADNAGMCTRVCIYMCVCVCMCVCMYVYVCVFI
jgi:tryptophanyl-tRNA synthetase